MMQWEVIHSCWQCLAGFYCIRTSLHPIVCTSSGVPLRCGRCKSWGITKERSFRCSVPCLQNQSLPQHMSNTQGLHARANEPCSNDAQENCCCDLP
jgi:hypothetical protein